MARAIFVEKTSSFASSSALKKKARSRQMTGEPSASRVSPDAVANQDPSAKMRLAAEHLAQAVTELTRAETPCLRPPSDGEVRPRADAPQRRVQ